MILPVQSRCFQAHDSDAIFSDSCAIFISNSPSRPQYESCGGGAATDIICPMYPSPTKAKSLVLLGMQTAAETDPGRNW